MFVWLGGFLSGWFFHENNKDGKNKQETNRYALGLAVGGEPLQKITLPTTESKITAAIWANLDDLILTGHENGECKQFEMKVSHLRSGVIGAEKHSYKQKRTCVNIYEQGATLLEMQMTPQWLQVPLLKCKGGLLLIYPVVWLTVGAPL